MQPDRSSSDSEEDLALTWAVDQVWCCLIEALKKVWVSLGMTAKCTVYLSDVNL